MYNRTFTWLNENNSYLKQQRENASLTLQLRVSLSHREAAIQEKLGQQEELIAAHRLARRTATDSLSLMDKLLSTPKQLRLKLKG